MPRVLSAVLAALTTLLGGCGTMANIALNGSPSGGGSMKVYGGVQRDMDIIHDLTTNPEHPKDHAESVCFGTWTAVAAVDMPFSFFADTLTLPITIPVAFLAPSRPVKKPRPDSEAVSPKDDDSEEGILPDHWMRSGQQRPGP